MPQPIDLDPENWDSFRQEAHQALDGIIDHLKDLRSRPLWRQAPDEVKQRFQRSLPREGSAFSDTLAAFDRYIQPYANGNGHPLFMGWVHGAGTPVGMVAEMLAAGLNSNCGGRNHIAMDVERQIALWMAEAVGFPLTASGIFVTGSSMANFLSVVVARTQAAGETRVRETGVRGLDQPLVAYTSREAHNCIRQAMELSGLGSAQLRLIDSDERRMMRLAHLREAIHEDRAAGRHPFLVVGTAGTVDAGAVDDLDALAAVAQQENMWFHVDGAFGALAALSPVLRPRLKGIERADSIAFDFHKWLHVPYDAGFVLVRDPQVHRRAFASEAAYLSRAPRGLAAGETWPCDLGADLSRSFRALKTWFTIETFGADKLARCIEQTCEHASRLGRMIEASPHFTLRAPVSLNVVCLGPAEDHDGRLAQEIVMDLHDQGEAAPSLTRIDGVPAIRAAIVNHRTRQSDLEHFMVLLDQSLRRMKAKLSAN